MTKARFPGLYEKTLLKIHDKKNHGNVPQENPISWRDIYMSKGTFFPFYFIYKRSVLHVYA